MICSRQPEEEHPHFSSAPFSLSFRSFSISTSQRLNSSLLISSFLKVHVSEAYNVTLHINDLTIHFLSFRLNLPLRISDLLLNALLNSFSNVFMAFTIASDYASQVTIFPSLAPNCSISLINQYLCFCSFRPAHSHHFCLFNIDLHAVFY